MRPDPRAIAAHLAIAIVATFPLVLAPLSRLVGHEDVDVWNHAWGPWWFWTCLTTGTLPWQTTLLDAPAGGVLWYIDPVGAIAGAPLVPILGVVGAYNLVILGEVALASAAGRSLALALGADGARAWLGAVATAFSPYLLSEIHNGVTEAVGIPWVIFALAAGRRALDLAPAPASAPPAARAAARRTALAHWATTGAWLGLTAAGTWYYGLGGAVTLAAWVLLARRRAALAGLVFAGVIAGVLAAPALTAAHVSVTSPDSMVFRGDLRGADRELLLSHNAVDPRAYVAPGGFQSVDLAARGEAFRHSSYVGLLALALALFARRPAVLLGILPAALLSLGPYLWWHGDWLTPSPGVRLGLPFQLLQGVLPSSAATHAQRVGLPVLAVVAALAGAGATRLPRRASWVLLPAIAIDALLAAPWPLARAPALDTTLHASLGARPADAAEADREHRVASTMVLDLPAEVDGTMATSRYLVYQTASGLPIPYRPDARAGTASLLGMQAFDVLAAPSLYRPEHREAVRNLVAQLRDVDLSGFGQRVRWIVVHRELDRGTQGIAAIEAQLVAWFGAPEVVGTHAAWDTRNAVAARAPVLPQERAPVSPQERAPVSPRE